MWCPQTRNEKIAIATELKAMKRYPKMCRWDVDGDDLRDDAHRGQDHDVDGRVRIEPEEVLEQHRVSAHRRVEETDLEDAFARSA